MKELFNIPIGKKLDFASAVSLVLLAWLTSMMLWTLADADTVAVKAQRYALKLTLATRVQADLSGLALHMSTLGASRQLGGEADKVLEPRREAATLAVGKQKQAAERAMDASVEYARVSAGLVKALKEWNVSLRKAAADQS